MVNFYPLVETPLTSWARFRKGLLYVLNPAKKNEWRAVATAQGLLTFLDDEAGRRLLSLQGYSAGPTRHFVTPDNPLFLSWVAALQRLNPERDIIQNRARFAREARLQDYPPPELQNIGCCSVEDEIDVFGYFYRQSRVPQVCFLSSTHLFFLPLADLQALHRALST